MDLRGRFSRKRVEEGDDRSRSRRHRSARDNAGEGKGDGVDASGLATLSRQSSVATGVLSRQSSNNNILTRHQSVHTDGRPEERRGFAQKINIFRPHSANASRASSTNTSSSSLLSLAEHEDRETGTEGASSVQSTSLPRGSEQGHGPPLSPLSEVPLPAAHPSHPASIAPLARYRDDFPVYPDQSYAVLQRQIHPSSYSPHTLRSRSSYPSHYHLSSISTGTSMWNQDVPGHSQSPRTVGNTPISSPGLFSSHSSSSSNTFRESHLHPTHLQEPKETHTVEVDRDTLTGNKLINEYEILDELGRGEHGKVKLGRDLRTGQKVAIKIVQRYSKRRRLGKLGNPEDKVKKEVAILKKARHPNVVSLLEVIDDPNQQKVYIVLEFVENGDIIWRKKGLKEIVTVDKERLVRERRGIPDSPSFVEESQLFVKSSQIRRHRRNAAIRKRREKATLPQPAGIPAWSLEHGDLSDDDFVPDFPVFRPPNYSVAAQDVLERVPSPSPPSVSPIENERRLRELALAAVEGSMYGAYSSDPNFERRYSTASSSLNQSSESDFLPDEDDMAYVPFLTLSEARCAFRDAVLGLDYLHYQGIIHRDIKPANLLVTGCHQVKISDFGVSYLGRPLRDGDEEQVGETDARELDDGRELSKTVGTPAFYAPELCYTGNEFEKTIGKVPKITGAIDVWSLGVTLYGMIFGRLPFVADDEFGLFQIIVKNPVFIPTKRLKAVESISSSSSAQSSSHQLPVMNSNKRTEDELVYEPIDDELRDLLSRLLEKDPTKRISLKEIKHHPWVLRDVPDPKSWVEETDPDFQSKGKKIEVSNEEVTRAVTKMPFIERVRSNVAKWGGSFFGRGREGRRRGASSAADMAHSASPPSSVTLGRDLLKELRRSSLRGDEDLTRTPKPNKESDHPLAQSVVPSPELGDGRDYFAPTEGAASVTQQPREQDPRPEPPGRTTSTISNAESAKTVRPRTMSSDSRMPKRGITAEPTSSSSGIGGLFGGAGRKLVKSLQRSDGRRDRSPASDHGSVDSDVHGSPSVAVTAASVGGQVQSAEALRDSASADTTTKPGSHDIPPPAAAHHRRSISQQCVPELPQREGHLERGPRQGLGSLSRKNSLPLNTSLYHHQVEEGDQPELFKIPPVRPMTSPPSAVTVSSSSADDFTSGMSYCASHPSIPSVVSGASSFSGEALHTAHTADRDKEGGGEGCEEVPRLLRTGDTVTARNIGRQRVHHDDESKYDCDDENEGDLSDDEEEEEGIIFGKKDPKPVNESSATATA